MRANRRHRLDRNAAEQLFRGGSASGPVGPPADRDALASLLAAAAAAGHDRELAGEAEAVTAFRRALLGPARQPRRPSMSATKLLAAKAVLATVGLAGGGVALAGATGHLPSTFTGTHAAASSGASAAAVSSADGKPTSHPAASPSPSLRGLCQAYTAQVGGSPGKALGNPAFSALITAAGGNDKVGAFCVTLLATPPGSRPTAHPTGKPTSLPASHPTGEPTSLPTNHPTDRPTSHP